MFREPVKKYIFDIYRLKNMIYVLYIKVNFKDKPFFEIIEFMILNKLDLESDISMHKIFKLIEIIPTLYFCIIIIHNSINGKNSLKKTYYRSK